MAEFKDRIKALRIEHDYTMEYVAEEINKKFDAKITKSHISRYESGQRIPSIVIASYFAKFYKVSLDYIVGLVDEPEALNGMDYVLQNPAKENIFAETSPKRRKVQTVKRKKEDNVG